ncbi:hypothetical protein C8R45DRAFT_1215104 [Mycena sanguinolenta]|nr:hypothetical protein C8R45DRAFT_1215104 [Mycena sanguinolenta]
MPNNRSAFSAFVRRAKRALTIDNGNLRTRRSSNAGSRASSVLPLELWLKIFSHIPLYLLPAVVLTCRSFRNLAQPLLFSTIVTHPQPSSSRVPRVVQTGAKHRRRIAERLEFFFSRPICLTVRECIIAPSTEDDDDLLDFIFDTLPSLPNLKVLECRMVYLTPQRLEVLQNLCLTTITLELCFGDISDFSVVPSVPLQEVTLRYPDSSAAGKATSSCPVFLSPTHLEHLHATSTSVLSSLVRSPPLTKLRTLELPFECLSSTEFIPALLRCPAVEHLSLHTTGSIPPTNFQALPDRVLPLLKSYCGPHHFAAAFLHGHTHERVEIPYPARPHSIEASLVKLDRGLRSLSFSLNSADIPSSLLQTIHRAFPSLMSLAIAQPGMSSYDIKAVLNAVTPLKSLAELTLRVQGRDKFNLWIPPDESAADAASCFTKVCSALVKAYPGIKRVRFYHGAEGASVLWSRSSTSGLFLQVSE